MNNELRIPNPSECQTSDEVKFLSDFCKQVICEFLLLLLLCIQHQLIASPDKVGIAMTEGYKNKKVRRLPDLQNLEQNI
jgi:hypothetical protein